MAQGQNWENDPLVRVQNVVWPVMWLGHQMLVERDISGNATSAGFAQFREAAQMLRIKGPQLMRECGVTISAEDGVVFEDAAKQVETGHDHVQAVLAGSDDPEELSKTLTHLSEMMQPRVKCAIELFCKLFISLVLERQRVQMQQANTAISGLDKISKQIFFISINASVEAARVGDAGRGFLQISNDIRALSQSAQDATRDLSNLVVG